LTTPCARSSPALAQQPAQAVLLNMQITGQRAVEADRPVSFGVAPHATTCAMLLELTRMNPFAQMGLDGVSIRTTHQGNSIHGHADLFLRQINNLKRQGIGTTLEGVAVTPALNSL
jgi:hypothetical protein